jgi:ribosomal protein S12 methylthiotransferase
VSRSITPDGRRVALLTLGCARNEVDSEELAGRLARDGWQVSTDADDASGADVVLVNTCGFVASAKRESVDTLLAAADGGAKVVAAGCLAERYGRELADSLPEAAAVLSFDDYPEISARLDQVLAGETLGAHTPTDRRTLLPLTPVARRGTGVSLPGHADVDDATPAHLRPVLRQRLGAGPAAPLKLASGCDRRCSFCAIPTFRGAFVSRAPDELVTEARWLATQGVRELVLVSENSTSYGKDLGDPRALDTLLPRLAAVEGIVRVRVSYLQPAELRPGLVEVIASTPGVAPYFDLSFQHASEPVLRRMRRFGSTDRFLALLDDIRRLAPEAGTRSNVIVGFPGETRADVSELVRFLEAARLDAVGVFGYSDEDGTEAATMEGKVPAATVRRRYGRLLGLADELCSQRAAARVGSMVEVLVESVTDGHAEGRAAHQAPEVDGSTTLVGGEVPVDAGDLVVGDLVVGDLVVGDLVAARVTASDGVDLVAVPVGVVSAAPR